MLWHGCPILSSCSYCQAGKADKRWNWLSAVYCICLEDADVRYKASQECFHACGLCTRVVYYRPVRASCSMHYQLNKGEYGCWQSHAAVNGKDLDHDGYVLVLEDDVYVNNYSSMACLPELVEQQWEVLYLGGVPMFGLPVPGSGTRIWNGFILTTEAYVTTQRARKIIVGEFDAGLPSGYQIDQFLARNTKQRYLYPSIFSQRSDVDSCIGYHDWLLYIMHFRGDHPRFTAACLLSLLPILIVLLLTLCIYLLVTTPSKSTNHKNL